MADERKSDFFFFEEYNYFWEWFPPRVVGHYPLTIKGILFRQPDKPRIKLPVMHKSALAPACTCRRCRPPFCSPESVGDDAGYDDEKAEWGGEGVRTRVEVETLMGDWDVVWTLGGGGLERKCENMRLSPIRRKMRGLGF